MQFRQSESMKHEPLRHVRQAFTFLALGTYLAAVAQPTGEYDALTKNNITGKR